MHWDDARVFLALARAGTLTRAAKQLGVGTATMIRRLDRLESALGVKLFSRHQNGYFLTDEGQNLLNRAEGLEQAGQAFGATAMHEVAGHVRLATAENLANPVIIPALEPLYEAHPGLTLELITGTQTVNLHRRDADLAVRMVKPTHGNVTLRRIGTLGFGLYGSATYLATRSTTATSSIHESDSLIGWVETHNHLPSAQWITRVLAGRPAKLMTSNLSSQLAAAQAGLGLAVLPHFLARQSGLQCVMPQLGVDQQIWLVMHSDLVHSRRIRVVADYLITHFEKNADSLAHAES
ncbi:MAG TPA: LysR family transcriptional regulator [Advenella kashmirensis]|uniref:LysR family transcriptional regulator n=1 Tax=Advenella kashmirensis TaxID=310575 RepID=A0A356LJW4_9BURK|nr:LysR family transcriptional regulator [Advenella kashmirensis]